MNVENNTVRLKSSQVNETAISNVLVNPSNLPLSTPNTPTGFKAPLIFDKTQRLNAFNLWRSALAAMYELAARRWDSILDTQKWVIAFSGSDVFAIVTADEPVVKIGYIIIALYNAVNAMFQLQPGFFKRDTGFILHGRKIGSMENFSEGALPGANSGHATSGNKTVNSPATTAAQTDIELVNAAIIKRGGNNTLTGTASDPDDPKLKIEFEYSRVVPRQDLWTFVLDGMATAAQYDAGARCEFITAVSSSGNLAFHINEFSDHLLSYNVAMKTFHFVALISMGSREYKEQEISGFYDGTKLAEGYILKVGEAALEGGGEPMSNE